MFVSVADYIVIVLRHYDLQVTEPLVNMALSIFTGDRAWPISELYNAAAAWYGFRKRVKSDDGCQQHSSTQCNVFAIIQ